MDDFKDSGTRATFEGGGQRDAQEGKGRYDLLPCFALQAIANVMETGAAKYDARNWEKGIPMSRYMDSGLRHLFKYLRGEFDEPHLEMALWNFACLVDTRERIRLGWIGEEFGDLPHDPILTAGAAERMKDKIMAAIQIEQEQSSE